VRAATEVFESYREELIRLAYRMLGDLGRAEGHRSGELGALFDPIHHEVRWDEAAGRPQTW